MSSYLTLVVNYKQASSADQDTELRPRTKAIRQSILRLSKAFHRIGVGARNAAIDVHTGAVRQVFTITFTDQPNDTETILIGDETFTAKASGASGDNQWNITSGGTAAADAAANATSLGALINAHSDLSQYLSASVSAGVITVTCLIPGKLGTGIKFEEGAAGMTNCTVATATAGTNGTKTSLAAGG